MDRRIEVTPEFCVLWALLLLLLPLGLLAAALAAALVHELCHVLVIRLLGGRILNLRIGAGGMVMAAMPMTPGRELLCALAGPMGSLLLACCGAWLPDMALCAFVQGCFNLLPLYPLDGGRALACGLQMAFQEHGEWILRAIEMLTLALLLAAAILLQMGVGPFAAWGILALRKIPCKPSEFGVQ